MADKGVMILHDAAGYTAALLLSEVSPLDRDTDGSNPRELTAARARVIVKVVDQLPEPKRFAIYRSLDGYTRTSHRNVHIGGGWSHAQLLPMREPTTEALKILGQAAAKTTPSKGTEPNVKWQGVFTGEDEQPMTAIDIRARFREDGKVVLRLPPNPWG